MTSSTRNCTYLASAIVCIFSLGVGKAHTQGASSQPVTDSSVQASPVGPALKAPATDESSQASPVSDIRSGVSIPAHTALRVSLTEGIDSGQLKNGQMVHARLAADVPLAKIAGAGAKHSLLRSGTPALLTVIGTVPAGKINAVGEISLELVHVGNIAVETDTLTFRGQPGHRDLPDSAPEVGTNAGLHSGMTLTFHVQPSPVFGGPPRASKVPPGSVTAVSSGSKPTKNASQIANRDPNQPSGDTAGTGSVPNGKVSQPEQPTGTPQPAPGAVPPH